MKHLLLSLALVFCASPVFAQFGTGGTRFGVDISSKVLDAIESGALPVSSGPHSTANDDAIDSSHDSSIAALTVSTAANNAAAAAAQATGNSNAAQLLTVATDTDTLKTDVDAKVADTGDTMTGNLQIGISSPTVINADGFIDFSTGLAGSPADREGRLFYDSTDKTLALHSFLPGVTAQIPEEMWIPFLNNTGSTILNGQVLYLTTNTTDGGFSHAALAKADVEVTARAAGLATADVLHGEGVDTQLPLVSEDLSVVAVLASVARVEMFVVTEEDVRKLELVFRDLEDDVSTALLPCRRQQSMGRAGKPAEEKH